LGLQQYNVYWGTQPNALSNTTRVGVPLTQVTVPNLQNGVTYYFAVDAENTEGQRSERSPVVSATPNSPNLQPPTLINTVPQDGMLGIALDTVLRFEFSEAMDATSVQVTVEPSVDLGTPQWQAGNTVLTFPWASTLQKGTLYHVTIVGTDVSGVQLGVPRTISFTTQDIDNTPPVIKDTFPADGDVDVAVNTTLLFLFSEPMQPGSFGFPIVISPDFGWTEAWNVEHTMLQITPVNPLQYGMQYTFTVTTDAQDLSGNHLLAAYTGRFTVEAAPDTRPPRIVYQSPGAGQVASSNPPPIVLRFSEPVDEDSVETNFTLLTSAGNTAGTLTWNLSGTEVTFQAASPFIPGEQVSIELPVYQDRAGNRGQPYYSLFYIPGP
jgi:hypothetical protein